MSASSSADLLVYSDLLPTNLAEISRSLSPASPGDLPSLQYIASLEGSTVEVLRQRLASTPTLLVRCFSELVEELLPFLAGITKKHLC